MEIIRNGEIEFINNKQNEKQTSNLGLCFDGNGYGLHTRGQATGFWH